MNSKFSKIIIAAVLIMVTQLYTGCLFETINQPSAAQPGEVITVNIKITDNLVPENNPHKGLLGVIVPNDWEFVSANYTSSIGNGTLLVSPQWNDSLVKYYPVNEYGSNMKWIALLSDNGYTYQNITSFFVTLKLKVGQTQGCFNIGYLTTKATSGLLGTGNTTWAPLSYPHPIGVPDSNLCANPYQVRTAPEWNNILNRKSGWTGSDGIYSIPLNGKETPSAVPADSQFFVFSDTFIGDVDSLNRRINNKLINNTLAIMPNNIPDTANIKFYWKKDNNGLPLSVFVPNTPTAKTGDWYWLMDGIALNQNIYVYALRLEHTTGGFGFKLNGVVLLKFNLNPVTFISNVQQFDTPLFIQDTVANWDIAFGQAIMPMTAESGNPNPDGYIYVYGPKSSSNGKELMAARVLPQHIENFSLYQYWNGSGWVNSINQLAPITNGISQEFSITPIKNNKFLAVYQSGSSVYVRKGDSPVGPFGIFNKVYDCPEVNINPNVFVYNAKAHPNLSDLNELLISYNVNSYDFSSFTNADIYRPRFIYLTINDSITSVKNEIKEIPSDYRLNQNYPNPFNPSTKITFAVPQAAKVSIKVFNVLGEMVADLANSFYEAGNYEVNFNSSKLASSGVYLCRMESESFVQTIKMMYLK